MRLILGVFILTVLTSCNIDKNKKAITIEKTETIGISINERLRTYFEEYRITPSITINNTEGNQTDIQLSNHKIKWLNTEKETKIKIDNDLFSLKDKVTLNNVWDKKDSVNYVNNWDEIKLFKHNDRELIEIRMNFDPCNGIGCSVFYFLVYDVRTTTKNFFGTFRTDNELELYDFGNDDKLDYVSKTYKGDASGATPIEFIYQLFSLEKNGQFKEKKNNSGLTYQLKHITFPNDTTKTDKLEQNWITKIK